MGGFRHYGVLLFLALCGMLASLPAALAAPALHTLLSYDDEGHPQTEWHVKITPQGKQVREGRFVRWNANGKPAVVGYYRDGQPVGVWRWYDEQGRLLRTARQLGDYEEVLKGRDLPQDQTVFRSPKGLKIAEGLFKYNEAHGKWVYYFPDGSPRAEGRFLVGIPEGRWTFYYPDGQVERLEEYKLGVPHGRYMRGYANGQERLMGAMDQGLRTGQWRTWYDNGQLESEGHCEEDRRNGEWRFWSRNGRLLRRVLYRYGAEVKELPLPKVERKPPPVIPHPETLPFRPRLYREEGGEIKPQPGY